MADARITFEAARELAQRNVHLDADPTYARLFLRRVSPYVSWFLAAYTSLSADAVTVMSIACGIAGGLAVAGGPPGWSIVAIVLLQLAYLLDVADGEVARIRGTAGRRGTYLDLIGHFLQNRALYIGAGWSLIEVTGRETWAIVVALLAVGFSMPFGLYARNQVMREASSGHPDHGVRVRVTRPTSGDPRRWIAWAYRRIAFIWNYPAFMNLFCLALAIDVVRSVLGDIGALAVPVLIAIFGPTLAAKQVAHAIRLLRPSDWQ
jgi:phosphatidylglycerophosphate synthase